MYYQLVSWLFSIYLAIKALTLQPPPVSQWLSVQDFVASPVMATKKGKNAKGPLLCQFLMCTFWVIVQT